MGWDGGFQIWWSMFNIIIHISVFWTFDVWNQQNNLKFFHSCHTVLSLTFFFVYSVHVKYQQSIWNASWYGVGLDHPPPQVGFIYSVATFSHEPSPVHYFSRSPVQHTLFQYFKFPSNRYNWDTLPYFIEMGNTIRKRGLDAAASFKMGNNVRKRWTRKVNLMS